MKMTIEDHAAVFLILQLAEQGRPVEIAAQFLASYIESAEGAINEKDVVRIFSNILEETSCLLDAPSKIWHGLLPGGADPNAPEFEPIRVKQNPASLLRVMVVSMSVPRGQGWIVYGIPNATWYVWDGAAFFTNESHPDSDQLSNGMIINVDRRSLTPKLPHEAADMFCEIART